MATLNSSKPVRIPVSFVPDIHYRPGSIPIVTVPQLLEPPAKRPSEFDRWFFAAPAGPLS
jgi:hypothetical protein